MNSKRAFLLTSSCMYQAGETPPVGWFIVDQVSHPPRCDTCGYGLEVKPGDASAIEGNLRAHLPAPERDWCGACANAEERNALGVHGLQSKLRRELTK